MVVCEVLEWCVGVLSGIMCVGLCNSVFGGKGPYFNVKFSVFFCHLAGKITDCYFDMYTQSHTCFKLIKQNLNLLQLLYA